MVALACAYVIYVRQPLNHFRSLSSLVCRHERRRQRGLPIQKHHHVINVFNVALWWRKRVGALLVVVRGSRRKAAGKAAALFRYQVYECVQRRLRVCSLLGSSSRASPSNAAAEPKVHDHMRKQLQRAMIKQAWQGKGRRFPPSQQFCSRREEGSHWRP